VSASEKRTVSLPIEQAEYIDTLVSSGAYASASEVVRAGLRALQERDAAVERWLREEVAPVYDAMQADPGRGIALQQVFDEIRTQHNERLRSARRDP
jgi:antitoxin ParD1/3/4